MDVDTLKAFVCMFGCHITQPQLTCKCLFRPTEQRLQRACFMKCLLKAFSLENICWKHFCLLNPCSANSNLKSPGFQSTRHKKTLSPQTLAKQTQSKIRNNLCTIKSISTNVGNFAPFYKYPSLWKSVNHFIAFVNIWRLFCLKHICSKQCMQWVCYQRGCF